MSKQFTADHFWSRMNKDTTTECWEWTGAITSGGYGNLALNGVNVQAHRVAYYLAYGGIKLNTKFAQVGWAKRYKMFVLHRCDNRKCCNPAHLFLGSMRTNLLDAYKKGRKVQPRSEHANAKLTAAQVRDIRVRYMRDSLRQVDLAKEFGVSQRAISLIVRNETYKDIV